MPDATLDFNLVFHPRFYDIGFGFLCMVKLGIFMCLFLVGFEPWLLRMWIFCDQLAVFSVNLELFLIRIIINIYVYVFWVYFVCVNRRGCTWECLRQVGFYKP